MSAPSRYLRHMTAGYFAVEHRYLRKIGTEFGFTYGEHGAVLAKVRRGELWYFTKNLAAPRVWYGPFRSEQAAKRAFDRFEES